MQKKQDQIDVTVDPKRMRILEGALKVFLAYGYTRTTMDDIARAADVSRPALYLLFKNKTDIYRAIGSCLLARSVTEARNALEEEGPFGPRVMEALDRALFRLLERIQDSPHGEELLDMKNSLAADILANWRTGLAEALTEAIAREAARRSVPLEERGLSAAALADILLDGLEGLKARGLCGRDGIENVRQIVIVIELALRK
ncbi:TetR family transcriptional regulator [Mesorhizobium sp. J18]|uniref:TetR/AcrR family transcriptional regulator n=1 Tax=Mesorhizobium sp. J18 TaxID=935263 RepID=UPI00119A9F11|nr:TetR/AcrR family transcriptional regulator [Mesorhizobium sp. J18]TWG98921.1 TetR family transcriptional regulator [Mesorhizobium sp. J18]